MRQVGGFLVAAALVVGASPAWAARTRLHDAAESPVYGEKAGGMIGRGLLNVLTSFVDVLVNVVNETTSGPPLIGTLVGVAKGAGCGTLRLGSGAVDLITFWVPGFNGFPVSDSYGDCLALAAHGGSPEALEAGPEAMGQPVRVTKPTPVSAPPAKTWKK